MLGTIDLELLCLAVSNNGRVDGPCLERSKFERLGVGRTLDTLASLRDRGLLILDSDDGSFHMTDVAYDILWSEDVPLWTRILRLLEIRSCSMLEIASMLNVDRREEIAAQLKDLQKGQFVMASPQIRDGGTVPEKIYEILPKGAQRAEPAAASSDTTTTDPDPGSKPLQNSSILNMINTISDMISSSGTLAQDEKHAISQKLSGLCDMLEEQTTEHPADTPP